MMSMGPRDPEKAMNFWYSSAKWKEIFGADEAETICVPPCLDVLKTWKRNDLDEAPHLAPNISGQKGEAAFMLKFKELNIGGILVSGLDASDLKASKTVPKEIIQKGEWDAIYFHQNRGIFVTEVKAIEVNDEDVINNRIKKAKTQLDRNIEEIKEFFLSLYQKECTCITGFICFPFRNEARETYEGYRIIDKSALNDRALFRKFFEAETKSVMIEVSLLQRFAAAFVCCRSKVEFHSQAYNAMQVATWIMEHDIAQKQDQGAMKKEITEQDIVERQVQKHNLEKLKTNVPGNGPSGKIILTREQFEIVEWREKCVTIRGAPGSGKTLILMLRALKAAMENKPGSVFVFVNEKLKAKYEHYFFEERAKIFVDDVNNIDRRPKVHTIDKISFAQPADDVFFDETPVEDFYIEMIESRVNYSGCTTIVFTGLHKPGEAVTSFRLYQPRLSQFKHFELKKVLRGTGNIFGAWEHYYPHGITIGHNICGLGVKIDNFNSFEQAQNEIANKIVALTNSNFSNTDLPSLRKQHIAVITCDDDDSKKMRSYFEAKDILCGQVNVQARKLKDISIVAVDVYLNTPSYEWPIVFIVLKPNVTKEEVLPIAASRCIASLTIIKYKNTSQSLPESLEQNLKRPSDESRRHGEGQNNNRFGLGMIPTRLVGLAVICLLLACAVYTARSLYLAYSRENNVDTYNGECSSYSNLTSIKSSLRAIYSKSYRNLIPFSLPFYFDIEEKWVNITLKLEDDSTVTGDYATLLKKTFAKADMLIFEGNPGVGKSSFMHRLAYEWTQSRMSDYDLVLYIELRKLREFEFKDIKELINHYMKSYLDEKDYEIFYKFINDTKCCKEHKILVLLDGYDESTLEKQCQELSDYFTSTISRPLLFHVLITSRRGYLSKLRNQGRFIFVDIIGFTTEPQRKEYISKHLNAKNDTESTANAAAVSHLLNTNVNLKKISESPLMLTFICLLHKKIIDGTEVELYMNIIWWMIDRYQKSNPSLDVPSLFGFEHDSSDNLHIIENNYQYFPQLHLLGTMAMQDIFKSTFTEADLREFQLREIVQQVGLLRKEETTDDSFHIKTEFSFVHRTVQEFIMALTFFFSYEKTPIDFDWYVFRSGRYFGYEIIQAKILTFLNLISSSEIKISELKKNQYSELIEESKLYPKIYPKQESSSVSTTYPQYDTIDQYRTQEKSTPQSSQEAIQLHQQEAKQGDANAQFNLGLMSEDGKGQPQSYEEAAKWYRKAAEQGHPLAQVNLGVMYYTGRGVPQSNIEAIKWNRKSAEQGNANAQFHLGILYGGRGVSKLDKKSVKWYRKSAEQGHKYAQLNLGLAYQQGRGVPQSDEEAVKWYRKSAEQGNANAQFWLGVMYERGIGMPLSYEEAVKWYTKSAEQGDVRAQFHLGNMCMDGRGVPQSDKEAVKLYREAAEQRDERAQYHLGNMYSNGRGIPQSYEEAVKWFTKSAEQGSARAQYSLGKMCEKGQGVPQSTEEAFKWYRKSAEQGHATAQFRLGGMYSKGRGVPQSHEEAVKWYRKSAEQGHANAQSKLKEIINEGHGISYYFWKIGPFLVPLFLVSLSWIIMKQRYR